MQEIRYDGSERLTKEVTSDDIERALADAQNRTVAVHKPGATFESQGKKYKVLADGTLARREKTARKVRRQARRNARRKNRGK